MKQLEKNTILSSFLGPNTAFELIGSGYDVIQTNQAIFGKGNVYDTLQLYKVMRNSLGLIVAETNLIPGSMSKKFCSATQGGLYSGIKMLHEFIYSNPDGELAPPSIIYTRYKDDVLDYCERMGINLKDYPITLLPTEDPTHISPELIEEINKHVRKRSQS